jgi:hypothetical protein
MGRRLPPVALDDSLGHAAQLLSESILRSTDGDGAEPGDVLAAYTAADAGAEAQLLASVSLTVGAQRSQHTEGAPSDEAAAAAERSVADAVAAAVDAALGADALQALLVDAGLTHVAVGTSAHPDGRVRLTLALISRPASLEIGHGGVGVDGSALVAPGHLSTPLPGGADGIATCVVCKVTCCSEDWRPGGAVLRTSAAAGADGSSSGDGATTSTERCVLCCALPGGAASSPPVVLCGWRARHQRIP